MSISADLKETGRNLLEGSVGLLNGVSHGVKGLAETVKFGLRTGSQFVGEVGDRAKKAEAGKQIGDAVATGVGHGKDAIVAAYKTACESVKTTREKLHELSNSAQVTNLGKAISATRGRMNDCFDEFTRKLAESAERKREAARESRLGKALALPSGSEMAIESSGAEFA